MSHSTEEFEYVLDLANVQGVEYNEEDDEVVTFVSKKVSEDELDDDDIVSNSVSKNSRVIEIGEIEALDMPDAMSDRKSKHRPVQAGVSEINANSTAATAGPYPVKVTDLSAANWAPDVEEGDIVRLSNNHVYARSNQADFGESIIQPSPNDGGVEGTDIVGELVGYVPLEDGVTVDAAARSVDKSQETRRSHNLDDEYGASVKRDGYETLKGDIVVKSGRTTGVSRGEVLGTSASLRVNYGDAGIFKLRDQLVTTSISAGGDSGSPLFHDETKELVGEVYAGSKKATISYKAANIEAEHGVEIMTEDENETDEQYVESLRTTVDIEMEEHDLDLVELSGDKPGAGESVEVTATVVGNYDGSAYIEVQGNRQEFELVSREGQEVEITIEAPDEYQETFAVDITGGYVL